MTNILSSQQLFDKLIAAMMLLLLSCMISAHADIRLTTLPERERTIIRFEDNGQVLVEEVRTLTLEKGNNVINFTWMGVSIDRGSIQMLNVDGVGFSIHSTNYPAGQANSLVWNTWAEKAGSSKVRISYLLTGLSRSINMRGTVSGDESHLTLRMYQELVNNSGESYDQALLQAAFGDLKDSPLANGEIRRQLSAKFTQIPFTKTYTFNPQLYGNSVAVHYQIANTTKNSLGAGLLPGGKIRIFQQTGGDTGNSEAFLGEDIVVPTAKGADMNIRIGTSKDIKIRRTVLKTDQDSIREHRRRPTHYHEQIYLRFEIENFTGSDKTVDLYEAIQNNHDNWDVLNPEQWLEKRIAPEKFQQVDEDYPLATLERDNARTLKAAVTVPHDRRMVVQLTLRLGDRKQ